MQITLKFSLSVTTVSQAMLNIFKTEALNVTLKFKRETLDLFYICGASIEELSSITVYLVLFVKRHLKYTDPVEISFLCALVAFI